MNGVLEFLLILVGVVGVASLVQFLIRKSILNEDTFKNIDSTLEIAELIFDVFKPDDDIKNKSKFILDLADTIAEFAHSYALSNDNKEELALRLLDEMAARFEIDIDENEKKLAKIVISESLKWLSKNVNLDEKS